MSTADEPRAAGLSASPNRLVLFDGVCGLCNAAVDFIIRHDRCGRISFAPLQGQTAERILQQAGLPLNDVRSIVFLVDGKAYRNSRAVLEIARQLPLPFPLVYPLIVVPGFVRDRVYRFVADHRYKYFGRKETCRAPTPAERERFI